MRPRRAVLIALVAVPICAWADDARDTRIRQDLSALVSAIVTTHPNPFTKVSRAEFDSAGQRLSDAVLELTDLNAYLEMKKLTASIGDAHTALDLAENVLVQFGFHYVPIRPTLYESECDFRVAHIAQGPATHFW